MQSVHCPEKSKNDDWLQPWTLQQTNRFLLLTHFAGRTPKCQNHEILSHDNLMYIFSIILPRFDVEKTKVRRKIFGSVNPGASRGPSGPKKITVGCVIRTVPRRNKVNQAVTVERVRASVEIISANIENMLEVFVIVQY